MRFLFPPVWCLTILAAADVASDWTISVNVAGVTVMGIIGYLIRRSVKDIEDDIRGLRKDVRTANGRIRIAELNIERIGAKLGIQVRRYEEPEENE